jgi:hypothetical protein
MTIKLCLLKSGEDIITDVTEMRTSENEDSRVVGYFFDKPCVVKMRNPQSQAPDDLRYLFFLGCLYQQILEFQSLLIG